MIQIEPRPLSTISVRALHSWQEEIDGIPGYPARVAEGKRQFANRNKPTNQVFADVRATLDAMCCGPRRCGYCEDSYADEVEHIRPKDLYPEAVFTWENYLYVCGPCNGPKNSKYALFLNSSNVRTEVSRKRSDAVTPPPNGDSVFIDPRAEDPLAYIILDLAGTFLFVPNKDPGTREYERGKYTIDTLRLNTRDALIKARRNAFSAYRARLREYIDIARRGGGEAERLACKQELLASPHLTVWREMQRQVSQHEALWDLFVEAPEALHW